MNSFPEQPLFNKVIITLNIESADGGLVLSDNTLSDLQYVVAKGSTATASITEGDLVRIDIDKLSVKVEAPGNSHEYITQVKVDPIFVEGVMFGLIEDRIIKTIIKTV